MIDLHCHSVYSDGTKTPYEIVKMADQRRIKHIALTDHDTVAGLPDFFAVKGNCERIAGTEISVDFSPGTMHMVGLFIDYKNEFLNEKLDTLLEARKERNDGMLIGISELLGREVAKEEISDTNLGELGRPHLAKFLIKEGVVKNMDEAFEKYLGKGKKLYLEKRRFNFEDSVEMIHQAGGVAVLAHPLSLRLEKEEYLPYIKSLMDKGLDALETHCSYHSEIDTAFFHNIAKKLEIPISAGSDFHGENKLHVRLGKWNTTLKDPENILSALRRKAETYK